MRKLVLIVTHALALAAGFAAGVYLLPILTVPPGPSENAVRKAAISLKAVSSTGKLAPGPDCLKPRARRVGGAWTFENFIVVVWCETFSMFISAAKYR